MVERKVQGARKGAKERYENEKMLGQAIPTVEEIMAETGMSRHQAIKEYQIRRGQLHSDTTLPSPANYVRAYDSWSMD